MGVRLGSFHVCCHRITNKKTHDIFIKSYISCPIIQVYSIKMILNKGAFKGWFHITNTHEVSVKTSEEMRTSCSCVF